MGRDGSYVAGVRVNSPFRRRRRKLGVISSDHQIDTARPNHLQTILSDTISYHTIRLSNNCLSSTTSKSFKRQNQNFTTQRMSLRNQHNNSYKKKNKICSRSQAFRKQLDRKRESTKITAKDHRQTENTNLSYRVILTRVTFGSCKKKVHRRIIIIYHYIDYSRCRLLAVTSHSTAALDVLHGLHLDHSHKSWWKLHQRPKYSLIIIMHTTNKLDKW